jgi:hypothetical protein
MIETTGQQYRVIADRDRGDWPRPQDIQDGDRYTLNAPYFGDSQIIRIERPVPVSAGGQQQTPSACSATYASKPAGHPWQGNQCTLEAGHAGMHQHHGTRWRNAGAAPPSIADMAPGTTFRATTLFVINSLGKTYATSELDPSTIRDVTPATHQDG